MRIFFCKYILILSLLILFGLSIASSTVTADSSKKNYVIPNSPNSADENGLKQGQWTIMYDLDWKATEDTTKAQFFRLINYQNNKPNGIVKDYFITGEIQNEYYLISEEPEIYTGAYIRYYINGRKAASGEYENGKKVGHWQFWLEDGNVDYNFEGLFFKEQGKYNEAESSFTKALDFYQQHSDGNLKDYSNVMNNLADLYIYMGKFKESETLFKKVINIQEQIGEDQTENYSITLMNLSNSLMYMGRYAEAEELIRKSIDIHKTLHGENDTDYAIFLSNLANLCLFMGKYTESENNYKKAMEIQHSVMGENNPDYATSLNNLALLYNTTGKYYDAEPLLKKALDISKIQLGENHPGYASCLNNMGLLYVSMGRYQDAELLFKKAIDIIKTQLSENHPDYAACLNGIGNIYQNTGKLEEAEAFYGHALIIKKNQLGESHPDYAASLNNLANLCMQEGNYNKADTLFNKALLIRKTALGENHSDYALNLNNLALLYQVSGKYKEAEELFKRAVEILFLQLGESNPDYGLALNNLAYLYYQTGNLEEAEPLFNKCCELTLKRVQIFFPYLNEVQKINFWNTLQYRINNFFKFASKQYQSKPPIAERMLDLVLITKGIVLNSTQKALMKVRLSKRTYEEWQNTRQFYYNLVQNPQKAKTMGINVDSVEKVASELEIEISGKFPEFKRAFDTTLVRWQDVQKVLKLNEAAIEIIRVPINKDTIFYLGLILRKDLKIPELIILKNGSDLEGKFIKKYADLVEKQQRNEKITDIDMKMLGELYNNYWKPFHDKIKEIRTVFISLDGVYNQFNLNTLLNSESSKYVLDEINIKIISSCRDLVKMDFKLKNSAIKSNKAAKLFGNPLFKLNTKAKATNSVNEDIPPATRNYYLGGLLESLTRTGITPLPGTKKEIDTISNYLEKMNWKVEDFLEESALEENVKAARNPRILHLATHGVFLEDINKLQDNNNNEINKYYENPLLRSMLLFTGAENTIRGEMPENLDKDDGILTAYEVMNLDFDYTELVVLSACKTGLGEIKNGEGVYGLQRAFQVAGAKSLVMSLWPVRDDVTQELMSDFYNHWLSGIPKREAFRTSQLHLKEKYPGFYCWGAFIMVGE